MKRYITICVTCFCFALHAEVIPLPSPVVLTPAQKAANQIVANGNQMFKTLVFFFNQSYNLIWNNKNVSSQDVYTALEATNPGHGVGAKVVAVAASLRSLVNSVVPNTLPAPLCPLTTNGDGTVTVVCPSPTPSPAP